MRKSHDPSDFPKDDVRSAIQTGIARAESQMMEKEDGSHKRKSKSRKRRVLFGLGSVAAIFVILLVSSSYSPALANSLSRIPFIGSVFGDSDLIGLRQAHEKGLTSEVGETQTINGISVTVDEILYDNNHITISYIIESEKDLGEFYFGAGADITINGELPMGGSSGYYGEDIQSSTTRTAIQGMDVSEEMPDEFELGLILHGEKGETWYFSTPIKQITDIKKIPVQHSQHVDGIDLTVTELSLSEAGIGISFESSEAAKDFELSRAGDIEFVVVDQNGNEITNHSGGVSGERIKDRLVFTSRKRHDPVDSSVTELTITPYLRLATDGGGVEPGEDGKVRELEFKGDLLKPVEFESFKVEIPQ